MDKLKDWSNAKLIDELQSIRKKNQELRFEEDALMQAGVGLSEKQYHLRYMSSKLENLLLSEVLRRWGDWAKRIDPTLTHFDMFDSVS